jgi:thiol-disulfide isomerase/thioredoxin
MKHYIRKRWNDYWTKKSWFSKISDLFFVLFIIAMLIPTSRKAIRIAASNILASSPKSIAADKQLSLAASTYDWLVYDMEGRAIPFSNFRGQTIFLNFWATWCAPCIAEMPDIQKLYDQFGDEAAFLLVSDEDPARILNFMKKRGFDMPVYIRRGGVPSDLASGSIPVTFVISPKGQIVIRKTGVAKWNSNKMQDLMHELIAQTLFQP